MIVYADILVTVNLIVDWFLIKAALKILRLKVKPWRTLCGAACGAIFSLYIFLPTQTLLTELLAKFAMNAVIALAVTGFKNLKHFMRCSAVLFAVTCVYGGSMIALWQILRPKGMIFHNSVVYFNISPVILICCTVIGYFLYLALAKLLAKEVSLARRCEITISALGKTAGATAIIDTGNSITDIFSDSQIIIADKAVLLALFGTLSPEGDRRLMPRFRTVPCNTVSGQDVLQGFRCDGCKVALPDRLLTLEKPIVLCSKVPIKDGYSAILNPKILELAGENNENEKLNI